MHRVAAKFVPRLLTGRKTEPRHNQSGAIRPNTDENFLKNVITGDEK
jgi:hypothetical protein